MCLYGPPGTGKTTYGHWLSKQLNVPIHAKKASDILSPFVGMTERNLARVFQKAKEDEAVLLLDEVDTFLQDRKQAHRSWEVSGVNELLTQMEQFEGVFVASTNLMEGLDQASLRRFDLKIYFDYLLEKQCIQLLKAHSKELQLGNLSQEARDMAASLTNATPGDFANVARQHRFKRFSSPEAFMEAVAKECALKPGSANKRLGFFAESN